MARQMSRRLRRVIASFQQPGGIPGKPTIAATHRFLRVWGHHAVKSGLELAGVVHYGSRTPRLRTREEKVRGRRMWQPAPLNAPGGFGC